MNAWTADELMRIQFPEPKWAVPGLMAEGVNLLVGPPKAGKSWLALNLGVAIGCGGKALGSVDVDPGPVLYLALEDTGRRLQGRLRGVLAGSPAPTNLTLATECPTLATGGVERIEGWLGKNPGARLVIVDVFAKVRGASTDTSNLYAGDYAAMGMLKSVADSHGVAVLVLHHTRKSASDDFIDTVSGTQGLAGAADAIMVLSRTRNAADALLKVTGRDIEEAEHALRFHQDDKTWRLLEGEASDYALRDTRRAILRLLRDGEPRTPKAIALELSLNYETVKKTCRRMVPDQLDTDGTGTYFAPMSPVPPVPPVPQEGGSELFSLVPRDMGDTGDRDTG